VHNGLYYLDEGSDEVAFASKMSPCPELLLLHRRLGHPSFAAMSRSYPSPFNACPRESLICDACEFAKHTRVPYPSLGLTNRLMWFIMMFRDHVRSTLFMDIDGL
jgi:hypothetical protein